MERSRYVLPAPFCRPVAAGAKAQSEILQKERTQRFHELSSLTPDLRFGGGRNGLSLVIEILRDLYGSNVPRKPSH